ncbi:hypothetical protein GPJ56_011048 [Histomonas meleagridis]|uniref:uncharacterized protein n=1 Tax=Histomonas meleagridis TaxID=135588 RepID=UPI003559CF78|nr:hypothetical protein GPJ56_011048 [Histomonas meleagridis]KAH0800825.1 hypothetical protein GO595_006578 [Histomonas meleagridis]
MEGIIQLATARGSDDPQPQIFNYRGEYTGSQLLTYASFNLKLPIDTNNVIKFIDQKEKTKTVNPDATIESQGIISGMTIYILSRNDLSSIPSRPIFTPEEVTLQSNTGGVYESVIFESNRLKSTFDNNALLSGTLQIPDPEFDTGVSRFEYQEVSDDFNLSEPTDSESAFGGIKASDLINNLGYEDTTSGKNNLTILTYNGFNDTKNAECLYQRSDSFDEVLRTALSFLSIHNLSFHAR